MSSFFTPQFAERLERLGSSLLISTYQAGKLVCARVRDGQLDTHFRDFDKPMGIAVAPGRFCLGTRTEVWDMRERDGCFRPHTRHATGDVNVHELAFAGGELWLVATALSCLGTVDGHLAARWKPPFVSAIVPEDRCHLSGVAVVDDRVRYVTTLGASDAPGGWREGKRSRGLVLDVETSETVAAGLSMPHSPRWHEGRLWLLESGCGALCTIDLAKGRPETVIELPGFARGLALAGEIAYVGLSKTREYSREASLCGVWAVDIRRGAVEGHLRFEDRVREVFDVALLPGARYPEISTC